MDRLPDLSSLSHAEKDALMHALWAQVQALPARVAELEAKLGLPRKTPDNSSLPPSLGKKPNRGKKPPGGGPRQGSLGRKGGGRLLAEAPDETVTARPARCAHCQAALDEADQTLAGRFDKVDLPTVAPVVTRVERYAGHCGCCGGTTLAPLPQGVEPGTPFSRDIVALAAFRRGKPRFDAETAAILARPRRARIVCSDETGVRIDGRSCWNWVFQNEEVVIHVVRHSRGAGVVAEAMGGHRPAIWVSDLYGAQRGHAEAWQICLAHQLRDCRYAADNNGSERELLPTATYRKVTGGFRSTWGADLYAAVRSVIGTAARRDINAYQAIRTTLHGQSVIAPAAEGVGPKAAAAPCRLRGRSGLPAEAGRRRRLRRRRGRALLEGSEQQTNGKPRWLLL